MNKKLLVQILAVFLIPCLLWEPAFSAVFSGTRAPTWHNFPIVNEQALIEKPFWSGKIPDAPQQQFDMDIAAGSIVLPRRTVNKLLLAFLAVPEFVVAQVGAAEVSVAKVLNWVQQNHMASYPKVPKSFQVPANQSRLVWNATTGRDAQETHMQRAIIDRGLEIYDGALSQILWMLGGNLDNASLLTRGYMGETEISAFQSLRGFYVSGDGTHPFQYGEGTRGRLGENQAWLFRIFADVWKKPDPLDNSLVEWQDWRPIAGENAWAAMASLQVAAKKYGSRIDNNSVEMRLARGLAETAMLMQADNGGIRYAPQGTFISDSGQINENYYVISTENNLSWYATFRMLYQITKDPRYLQAMTKQENYFKAAWNKTEGVFAQGMRFNPGRGWILTPEFATDCQTWAVLSLGTETIDKWFGESTTYHMLQKTFDLAGVKDAGSKLQGVDFTDYRQTGRKPMVSIEWTGGAIMAARHAADDYDKAHKDWSTQLRGQGDSMWQYALSRGVKQDNWIAFPYATGKASEGNRTIARSTGFGWYAAVEEVLSLASSVWMALVPINFNPMILGGGTARLVADVLQNPKQNNPSLDAGRSSFAVAASA